jgi:SMODS and SLOG-associating 2TM effector domain 3/SMODS and SLOG-associating 2TM effector domain 1
MNDRDIPLDSPTDAFPAILTCADQSSTRAQRHFLLITATILVLIAVAASMGAVDASWAGWVGASAFLSAFMLGALAVTHNLERTWYDGRALAESAKSLTWLYVARGGPFHATDPDADEAFKTRLRSLRNELRALDFVVASDGVDITPGMRSLRHAPLKVRREHYERQRLGDQIEYYRRRSEDHNRQALRFRVAAWAAQGVGLIGAILKATSVLDVDLLGVGAACAAGFTAWLQTRDHVTLARAYELTAEDLDRVKQDGPPHGDEMSWGRYVADAEAAMSREHVMWTARRGRIRHE